MHLKNNSESIKYLNLIYYFKIVHCGMLNIIWNVKIAAITKGLIYSQEEERAQSFY